MIEFGLGIVVFTGLVLCLVLLILAARGWLVPSGNVVVTVNDTRALEGRSGDRLLNTLAEVGIHLPSACGGRGTCGQCRVTVGHGGGTMLATEAALVTKREARAGIRLACQVALKSDMAVEVPEDVFGVKHWRCIVRSNQSVGTLIKELVLQLPPGDSIDFRAGSYVVIHCPAYQMAFSKFDIATEFRGEWDRLGLWHYWAGTTEATTRAYSLANFPEENEALKLVVRIALPPPGAPDVPPGIVSSYLFGLGPGDEVEVSGPFGHFFAADSEAEMVFVAGGAGMAPIRSHIFDQLKRLNSDRKITLWYGARSRRELFYIKDFDQLQRDHPNFQWFHALSEPLPEDNWTGDTGYIHDVLFNNYLKDHPEPEECEFYLCGPPMMIRATRNMLNNLGVDPDTIRSDDFGVGQ